MRVLDILFPLNISLQTLSGIASHDGELELSEYKPKPLSGFREFDAQIEACYCDAANVKKLVPCTLEGCAVRISDIIAYLGKDRQDAQRVKLLKGEEFAAGAIGSINAEIVNNLTVNIIENSYGKGYVKLDETHFAALRRAKQEDYDLIYRNEKVERELNENVRPMAEELYEKLLRDLNEGRTNSPVFRHHIAYLDQPYYSRKRSMPYEETERNQIVVDYIASMTDDYFVDLYEYLFPHGKYKIRFKTYFG